MAVIDGKLRYIQTISGKNRGLWTVYQGSGYIDRHRIGEVVIWVPPLNLWGFEHSIPAFQLNYRLELNFNGGSLNFKGKALVIYGLPVIYKKLHL